MCTAVTNAESGCKGGAGGGGGSGVQEFTTDSR